MLSLIFMGVLITCSSFFLEFSVLMLMILLTLKVIFIKLVNVENVIIEYMFMMDLMSSMMILLTIWITFLMILSSFAKEVQKNKMFLFYVTFMMLLLMICFTVMNLLAFYFFFESVLFPIIMLIFGWGNQPERLQAGFYMLMYTIFGSFPMFVTILMYMYKNNTLIYPYMDWIESQLGILFIFLMMGFLVKIPMFLFHLWLPKAHVEAPISGSMILAGVLLKLGIYGIFRFKKFMMVELMNFSEIFVVVSIWGSVMISMFCLYQTDIKSLIAYSSVCHMGVVLAGVMSFCIYSSMGALLLMIGHGLCSSGLFCLANIIYERVSTRSMLLFKGMKSIFPSLTIWWFLFSIINMSAPLSMNLLGELFLSLSILKMSIFYFFPVMLIIFMSACYSIYMYSYINHGYGWVLWSLSPINSREYSILFFHLFPMILWILKISFFCKWI
ncbi:NADH dehydrogenase subunit 4 (mitochondrion) [Amblyomma americanum]|uniref:NADH-ubiquinone oxidoreductase chain 4 n=1 Tax=Amblyomma americanum TaxID=6943 RepID=A0A0K0PR18_AMBAM|nr:NADH dehydrogenase subunit 4 [Amblyomma americanum]AKQ50901.1 NADH dehydrogenase subunit 4 [Amblyomma americanum]UKT60471.1 NADH dehydrogenase subunit 4 [Amblyomma americanum]UKT60484.1 NADH dehydrogenase subunit 4 [Amblyomma americanum]